MKQSLAWSSFALLVLLMALAAAPVYGDNGHGRASGVQAAVPESGPDVIDLTLQVLRLRHEYKTATSRAKPAILASLIGVAQERHDALLSLMELDPLQVLAVALPQSVRKKLPSMVQNLVEEQVTTKGELQIVHFDDFANGIPRYLYSLRNPSGGLSLPAGSKIERFSLHFAGEATTAVSGSKVSVTGVRIDEHVAIARDPHNVRVLSAPRLAKPPKKGQTVTKRVAVILFKFQDQGSDADPYTPDYAHAVTFTALDSVAAYWNEVSFGQLSITPGPRGVWGWYTVAIASTGCDYYKARDLALVEAINTDQFNSSGYQHIIYAFPQTNECPWPGNADPYPGTDSWVNGLYDLKVVGHELGHNFGLQHSGTLTCTNPATAVPVSFGTIGASCVSREYDDPFSIMGNVSTNHVTNYQKRQLNFLDQNNIQTVTTDGTYSLTAIEKSTTDVQVLKIPRDTDGNGNLRYYYLEFRQPYGFDDFAPTSDVAKGISIRLSPFGDGALYGNAVLIDATLSSSGADKVALPVGLGFEDKSARITIETLATSTNNNPDVAEVRILFGPGACVRANPGLLVSYAAGLTPAPKPGDTVSYILTVANYDSSACGPSVFSVSSGHSLPSEWSQVLSPSQSLTLAPGSTATIVLDVTSDSGAFSPSYTTILYTVFSAPPSPNISPVYSTTAAAIYLISQ